MVTVLFCVVAILIVFMAFWRADDWRAGFSWFLVPLLVMFGLIFPFAYGGYVATNSPVVHTYEVAELKGSYYYLDGTEWRDVLSIQSPKQSDNLSVIDKQAPSSLWYWSVTIKEAYVPIVAHKGG